jgi:formate hydrogenlyase subunit 4
MQSRVGPNRAGPGGFYQWIADAVKLLTKEDLVPTEADQFLFRIAPYFMMVGFACVFVALPFSHRLVIAEMNVGVFYIIAVTALIVVGIIMSGWSSNSKWSLFGAIRSAAQIISYEIPAGMALMIPVLLSGTLSTQGIIRAQGPWPWEWYIFHDPASFAAFFIYFISALAEGNRTPFDLPEAESELVSGYNTEYSGMRFSYFFLVEWGNMWVMSALATTMFGPRGHRRRRQDLRAQRRLDGACRVRLHRHLCRQDPLLRLHRHVAALDAPAHPRRSDDEHVLEVSRARQLRGGALRRRLDADHPRGAGARLDHAHHAHRRRRHRRGDVLDAHPPEHQGHRRQIRFHLQLVIFPNAH